MEEEQQDHNKQYERRKVLFASFFLFFQFLNFIFLFFSSLNTFFFETKNKRDFIHSSYHEEQSPPDKREEMNKNSGN